MRLLATYMICALLIAGTAAAFDLQFQRNIPVVTSNIPAITFSPDGAFLAWGTAGGDVAVWSVLDERLLFSRRGHDRAVTAVVFDPSGRHIISGSEDKKIIIWDIESGGSVRVIDGFGKKIRHLAVSPDGRYLAAVGDRHEPYCWEFPSGYLRGRFAGHSEDVLFCDFSASGDRLLTVGEDKRIIVWDIAARRAIRRSEFDPHTMINSGVEPIAAVLSADRRFLAVGFEEVVLAKGGRRAEFAYPIAFYDWTDGALIKVIAGNRCPPHHLALTPDIVYAISENSTLQQKAISFWDILDGIEETNYPIDGTVTGIAFSPDGKHMAVARAEPGRKGESVVSVWAVDGVPGYYPSAEIASRTVAAASFGGMIELAGPDEPIFNRMPPPKAALITLKNVGVEEGLVGYVTERLEGLLVNNSPCVVMLERNRIEDLIKELKYTQSGLTETQAVEIGRQLEVEYLLLGNLRKIGNDLILDVKAVHVETSVIVGNRGVKCVGASLVDIERMVESLAPTIAVFE